MERRVPTSSRSAGGFPIWLADTFPEPHIGAKTKTRGGPGGTLSLAAIGSYVQNAVSVALAGNTLPAVLPQILTATLSNNTSVMLVGKYSNGPLKLFAGYEFIQYAPPSNPFAPGTGFSDIGGDFVCAGCTAINNTNINNTAFSAGDKLFHVFWTGVKYAVTDDVDVIGAYYHYDQPAFGAFTNCAAARRPASSNRSSRARLT